jgi:hypothetical protein
MTPFDAYKKYVAIKLHFNSDSYDYFKFSGKCSASKSSFEKRRDRHMFVRLGKIYTESELEKLLVANFLYGSNTWIGEVLSQNGRERLANFKKIHQSLEYTFSQDFDIIVRYLETQQISGFDALFSTIPDESNYPTIVTLVLQNIIKLETFIIMNKVLNFIPNIDKKISDNIFWPDFKKLCFKYSPFIQIDAPKYKQIMKKRLLGDFQQKNA